VIIVVDGISLMLDFMNYYAFVSFIVFSSNKQIFRNCINRKIQGNAMFKWLVNLTFSLNSRFALLKFFHKIEVYGTTEQ